MKLIRFLFTVSLFIGLFCCGQKTHAQLFSNKQFGSSTFDGDSKADSSKKKQLKTNDSISIYFITYTDTVKKIIDTGISLHHRNPLLSIWSRDIGNLGSPYASLQFNPLLQPALSLNMFYQSENLFTHDSIKFYNSTRPYTDIYYSMGTRQEQMIKLLHTQAIKPNWNVAAGYRRIGSPGNVKYNRTGHDNAFVSSHYNSNNLRYDMKASIVYNKIQQDENGGLQNENDLLNPSYNDRRIIPVVFDGLSTKRSAVLNYHRNVSLSLRQQYYFGKSSIIYNQDSSASYYDIKPAFGLRHRLYSQHEFRYYKDKSPDSAYYGYLYLKEGANSDSLYTRHFQTQWGSSLSLNIIIKLFKASLDLEAGYGVEHERNSNNNPGKNSYLNNYLFGRMEKVKMPGQPWGLSAGLKFYFTGNAAGNFLLDGQIHRALPKQWGQIELGLTQSLQTPSYMFQYYYNNYFIDIPLEKISISKFFAHYQNTSYHAGIDFNFFTLVNYVYADSNRNIQQYASAIPISQISFYKKLHWKKFILDNQILLQVAPNSSPIHLPLFSTTNRLAYESKIFKQKLQIATGMEFRYNTPFLNDEYIPIYQTFSPQYTRKIFNIPVLSYFFNFKVKRYRAAIVFDELQQLFATNNLNYPFYPTPNFMMRFKFNWVFIN